VKGKHITICFHVDDCKISHECTKHEGGICTNQVAPSRV
jgi:hypothetical protein